jgi:hypothetical protein
MNEALVAEQPALCAIIERRSLMRRDRTRRFAEIEAQSPTTCLRGPAAHTRWLRAAAIACGLRSAFGVLSGQRAIQRFNSGSGLGETPPGGRPAAVARPGHAIATGSRQGTAT